MRPMIRSTVLISAAIGGLMIVGSCSKVDLPPPGSADKAMAAFESEEALVAFLDRHKNGSGWVASVDVEESASAPMALPPPPPVSQQVTPRQAGAEQITNVQEAGVDEGGIVKTHGDHLVVLRRGRLFTVKVGGNALTPVDYIDAFPPGDPRPGDTWYDEMLIAGDMVVVIGYSYGNSGTEISRFDIASNGGLSYRDTHYLRSADYYSSRNYASRLIGDRLVLYAPLPIWWGRDWRDAVPGLAVLEDVDSGAEPDFAPIAGPSDLYVPAPIRTDRRSSVSTLHTVTECDPGAREFDCSTNGVYGGWGRSFYVSQDAVYVWTGTDDHYRSGEDAQPAWLYRMPLDGSAPQALQVRGAPVDQFSFREDGSDRVLNVVVRGNSRGDAMWGPEVSGGDVALLRLPLESFGDGSESAADSLYRSLPRPADSSFQNRFVGRHLLYSGENPRDPGVEQTLFAVPLGGQDVQRIAMPHGVSRLNLMGRDGVAIGMDTAGALGFSAIALDAATGKARLEDTFMLPGAAEGENRSQAFFYRPNTNDRTGDSGLLGLPVMLQRRVPRPSDTTPPPPVSMPGPNSSMPIAPAPPPPPAGYGPTPFLGSGSAIMFLSRDKRKLSPVGQLEAYRRRAQDDGCKASCVDWYGNARPIFLGNRIFALLGYELVEGRLTNGQITERRRVDFAPEHARGRGANLSDN
ncbi:hypothetical protein HME9302_01352 [Alteripontixanthobacter maritimus]|uniref:Beta propeller domain-containing protein n=1 Tax=Alteripontixanthobacter maritimus TaxID=2161824 RepID=A0A369Q5I4_9SPHN|nr:beta-propeller domain-containing protein [Alteripontixanthobacter maritimus]RDC60153.1 hypothetical protein HME9302_01352 [Alteripontixanthobacter maritimus]